MKSNKYLSKILANDKEGLQMVSALSSGAKGAVTILDEGVG